MKGLGKYRYTPIFILLFTWPFVTIAQQKKAEPDRVIVLPAGIIRFDSLGSLVARESGFVFSFNAGEIDPAKKIMIPGALKKLNDILAYLAVHYRLRHSLIGNHIIFYKSNSFARAPARSGDRQAPVLRKNRARLNKRETFSAFSEKACPVNSLALPDIGIGIAFRSHPLLLPQKAGEFPVKPGRLATINPAEPAAHFSDEREGLSGERLPAGKSKEIQTASRGKGNNRLYASAGLAADELLYIAPRAGIGLPWLFATASWATNFKVSGFFYGLGTSIQLSDNWDLQLSASSGTLSKDFRWPASAGDTMGRVKTRLTRIDILAGKHLGGRWALQFGPVFNFMKSKYALKGSSIANSFPSGDVRKAVYILNPPYTLSDSYNEQTGSGIKIWVGLRVGLLYTLW